MPDSFAFFVRQDYRFLIEYVRMLSYGTARAPDLTTIQYLSQLVQSALTVEMDLYRKYADDLGISMQTLEHEPMAPATQAYSDFLVRTAAQGDFVELLAAMLPCSWSYVEIGQRLHSTGLAAGPYRRWIESYASAELAEHAEWCRALVDRSIESTGAAALPRATEVFITSSRYELAFWDAALHRTQWPT